MVNYNFSCRLWLKPKLEADAHTDTSTHTDTSA